MILVGGGVSAMGVGLLVDCDLVRLGMLDGLSFRRCVRRCWKALGWLEDKKVLARGWVWGALEDFETVQRLVS